MNDDNFESCLGEAEKDAWISLKNVIQNFLGNYKSPDYKDVVGRMLQNFKVLGCMYCSPVLLSTENQCNKVTVS